MKFTDILRGSYKETAAEEFSLLPVVYVSVKVTLGTISLLVTDQRPMCDGWTGQIV